MTIYTTDIIFDPKLNLTEYYRNYKLQLSEGKMRLSMEITTIKEHYKMTSR